MLSRTIFVADQAGVIRKVSEEDMDLYTGPTPTETEIGDCCTMESCCSGYCLCRCALRCVVKLVTCGMMDV